MRKVIGFSVFIVFGCALAQAEARAQGLRDPMRPPSAEASGARAPAAANSALQVVITSPERKLAVINGAVVPLGSAVGDSTLAGVSDSLAVLQKKNGRDVLLMHPNIDKRPARPAGTRADAP